MAVSKVAEGVFLVSPDKVDYKDTQAYKYTQIFTKARERQWQMAQDQALLEYKTDAARFSAEMKAYQDRAKSLNDQVRNLDTAIANAGRDAAKAVDAARKAALSADLEIQKAKSAREIKAEERVPVAQGGVSERVSVSDGGEGGGYVASSAQRQASAVIGAAKLEVGANPSALAANVETRAGLGQIAQTDPDLADFTRAATVNEAIEAKYSELLRDNPGADPAEVRRGAELLTLDELDANNPAFSAAYRKRAAAGMASGGGGRRSETVARSVQYGSRLEEKYPGLAADFEFYDPAQQQEIYTQLQPDERAQLVSQLQERRAKVLEQLAAVPAPVAPTADLITRAREISAGRFGPTKPAQAFAQRDVLDAMLRLPPEQRQRALDEFMAARIAPPPVPPLQPTDIMPPVPEIVPPVPPLQPTDIMPPPPTPAKEEPPPVPWLGQRLGAAGALTKKPDRMQRLMATDAGRLATQYYQAEKSAGYSVMHTVNTTLKNELSDKPELRDRVTEMVLAMALKDISSKNPA